MSKRAVLAFSLSAHSVGFFRRINSFTVWCMCLTFDSTLSLLFYPSFNKRERVFVRNDSALMDDNCKGGLG